MIKKAKSKIRECIMEEIRVNLLLSKLFSIPFEIFEMLDKMDLNYEKENADNILKNFGQSTAKAFSQLSELPKFKMEYDFCFAINTEELIKDIEALRKKSVKEILENNNLKDWKNLHIGNENILFHLGRMPEHYELFKEIVINYPEDVANFFDSLNQNVLFYPNAQQNLYLFSKILNLDIDINTRNVFNQSVVDKALCSGNMKVYECILKDKRFDVNKIENFSIQPNCYTENSVFYSILNNLSKFKQEEQEKIIDMLLNHKKFDINKFNNNSYLYYCLYAKNFALAEKLIYAGADIVNINKNNSSLLFFIYDQTLLFNNVIKFIEKEKKRLINKKNYMGLGALLLNIGDDNDIVVKWLIDNGEVYSFKDSLKRAFEENSMKSIMIFLERENNLNIYKDFITEEIDKATIKNKKYKKEVDFSEVISYIEKKLISQNNSLEAITLTKPKSRI